MAAAVWIVREVLAASDDVDTVSWPALPFLVLVGGCIAVTLLLAAASWVVLVGAGRTGELVSGFLLSQLGKYVPGGVVQVFGQVDTARRAGAPSDAVVLAIVVHALATTITAGGFAAVVLALFGGRLDDAVRIVLGVAGAGLVAFVVGGAGLRPAFDRLHSRWSRLPTSDRLPSRSVIGKAALLGALGSSCYGVAFVVMVDTASLRPSERVAVAAAFVVSFTIGFLVVPLPSGFGAREAAIVLLLGPYVPEGRLLAASIGVRVVQLAVEIVLAGSATFVLRRSRPRPITSRG